MDRKSDIENLLAWMDGELTGPEAQHVAELVKTDPAWREAFEQFSAVDRLTGLIEPARPRRDLTDRIVHAANRRKSRLIRIARIAAPLAAAACIVMAIWLGGPEQKSVTKQQPTVAGVAKTVASILKDIPAEDHFIVRNLHLFRNYDEVTQYQQVRDLADAETLSALIEIDNSEEM